MFIIYRATNTHTLKSYIGLTKQSLAKRQYQHCRNALKCNIKNHFYDSIRKHGAESWIWEIIHENISNVNDARNLEREYIAKHDTYHNGYNSSLGGENFMDPEYQRENQLLRVSRGTHPFVGGDIQRRTALKRRDSGDLQYFFDNRKQRVLDGTNNLMNPETNPQTRRKLRGDPHHNQNKPWMNTKANHEVWKIADQLYDWYISNHTKKRGGKYKSMADAFGFNPGQTQIIYKRFDSGWNPRLDESWVMWS